MVHSGENPLKVKLDLVGTYNESIDYLGIKLKEYHK